jgi:hypothetical protein
VLLSEKKWLLLSRTCRAGGERDGEVAGKSLSASETSEKTQG